MTDQSNNADETAPKQQIGRPFQPGQSGNPAGRPKGARSKLAEDFLRDLLSAWGENGVEALKAASKEKPAEFCKMVAGLMPKDVNVTADHTVTHVNEPVSATADWIAGVLRERAANATKKLM